MVSPATAWATITQTDIAVDNKTRTIQAAGLSTVSDDARGEAGSLAPLNLAATGAGKEEGVFIEQLPPGTAVIAHTANHVYRIEKLANERASISGHEKYCPEPVLVVLKGTRWLDSELDECYVAPGMQLRFQTPEGTSILTSPISSVRVDLERKA